MVEFAWVLLGCLGMSAGIVQEKERSGEEVNMKMRTHEQAGERLEDDDTEVEAAVVAVALMDI